jgi:predicted nucleotidyltransferase
MEPGFAVPQRAVDEFCLRWNVQELSLFGSVAGGAARPDSDVDLLVTFAAGARWSGYDLVDMIEELKDIFGRDVDLVEKAAIRNPFLRREILRTARVLYAA